MLTSFNSPQDPHDEHLKHLLDQRSTRADLQGRFSALSQLSDTPSVYSHPFFSPRPLDKEFNPPSLKYQPASPTKPALRARSNRERLEDPAVSILDFDEDPRLSIASYNELDEETNTFDDEDGEAFPRMSLLGPKMRFHSRAPWEVEENTVQEVCEAEHTTNFHKKGFGHPSPRSSPSRPSGESTRSQPKSKHSYETTASQPSYHRDTLYTLAQESLSTSSLGLSSTNKVPRGKISLTRVRSESTTPTQPSLASGVNSPANTRSIDFPPRSHEYNTIFPPSDTHSMSNVDISSFDRKSPTSVNDCHPYANPDLVVSYVHHQSSSPNNVDLPFDDSIAAVTDPTTFNSLSRSGTKPTLTPVTSMSSVTTSRNRTSSVQGKEISSPINHTLRLDMASPANAGQFITPLPPGIENLPGWTDRAVPPTFALISLEEARAQRSRSATVHPIISRPSAAASTISFPDTVDSSEDNENSFDHSEHSSAQNRNRARSFSVGTKAKSIHTTLDNRGGQLKIHRDEHETKTPSNNSASGKFLKHKRSGFMRLFNSGRTQEDRVQPPPVPLLSDAYVTHNAQAVQKIPKMATHRVPVPELSPSALETPSSQEDDWITPQPAGPRKPSPSPKRPIPSLSINTHPQNFATPGPVSATGDISFQKRGAPSEQPWLNDSIPQSAPANVSEFPTLKLRPISTAFNVQFGDHVIPQESRPSLEADLGTPGSSSNVFSPITPDSSTHLEYSANNGQNPMTDQSSVINALKDQILTAKLAWQRRIWELEGQVKDLKIEVDELRTKGNTVGYCDVCGRGQPPSNATGGHRLHPNDIHEERNGSVIHRPRARTGNSSRFGSTMS